MNDVLRKVLYCDRVHEMILRVYYQQCDAYRIITV